MVSPDLKVGQVGRKLLADRKVDFSCSLCVIKGRGENHRVHLRALSRSRMNVSALSAGAYTTILYMMEDIVKGGEHAPPPPSSQAWAFFILMECTPESGRKWLLPLLVLCGENQGDRSKIRILVCT